MDVSKVPSPKSHFKETAFAVVEIKSTVSGSWPWFFIEKEKSAAIFLIGMSTVLFFLQEAPTNRQIDIKAILLLIVVDGG